MKNRFALALCAALVAGVGSASAADLPRKAPMAAPVVAQVYNWTGLYVGVHGGYGWGDVSGLDVDGWFLGGQVGFNWQAPGSPIVFGIEVDSAWANIEGSEVGIIPGFAAVGVASEIQYQGSLRGRVGYAFDRALLYVTGGLAWMHNGRGWPVRGRRLRRQHPLRLDDRRGPRVGLRSELVGEGRVPLCRLRRRDLLRARGCWWLLARRADPHREARPQLPLRLGWPGRRPLLILDIKEASTEAPGPCPGVFVLGEPRWDAALTARWHHVAS